MSNKPGTPINPPSGGSAYNLDYKKYEDNIIMAISALLLGLGVKTLTKREVLPVTGARKMVETFLAVLVATIIGEEFTDKMRRDGYLK